MKRILFLLALCAVVLAGGTVARAAFPAPAPAAPSPTPAGLAPPLEYGAPGAPAPRITRPAAGRVANDPHWRSPNVRANTDTTTYAQQEPSIAVNPLNPLNIVVAAKDERRAPMPGTETKEVWIYTSTDGGLTWPVQTHVPVTDPAWPQQSDPVVTFSDDNTVYLTIIGLAGNNLGVYTAMVSRSTDAGLTWAAPVPLNPGFGGADKEWTAIDLNPSSPYYHRLYTTWTNFSFGTRIVAKWSSDGGQTWNPPGGSNYTPVSFGPYDTGQFSMPVVLTNGHLLVTWSTYSQLAVAKSTDGGQTFISNIGPAFISPVNSVPGGNWRVNTIPSTAVSPATGTVVSVWADGRNGKDDIYYVRSTDNGATWSAATRVAHNGAGSSYQVEPWVSVAPNGRFDVIWYDDRDFPLDPNTFHIYATHSTDDGATWTGPDEQVTDAPTDLNVGIPQGLGWNGAAGDYIGVTSLNGVAYAAWTDTRNGVHEDIYTSRYLPLVGSPTPTATGGPSSPTPSPTAPLPPSQTATPAATATACTLAFTDVDQNHPFYPFIRCLACRGVISGYADGTFRPANNVTRGQTAKIVSNAASFANNIPSTQQTFADVTANSPFWLWVERLAIRNVINGYTCGGGGEPCDPQNRPYFRPNADVTRGQTAKIVSEAAQYADPVPTTRQTFADVPPTQPFWLWIERVAARQIISGYTCGGPGEPCDPAQRPYFRSGNPATRGQATKIIANTFFPNCVTPLQR